MITMTTNNLNSSALSDLAFMTGIIIGGVGDRERLFHKQDANVVIADLMSVRHQQMPSHLVWVLERCMFLQILQIGKACSAYLHKQRLNLYLSKLW